jgi:8-oxo-dGTP pyrophosphatase MutT (NUDIX family)
MGNLRVVGCFIEYKGKFIILHRLPDKSQGDTWGLPAGKVDEGESDIVAIVREIKEETNLDVKEDKLEFLVKCVWQFPEKTVEFPAYRLKLQNKVKITHQPNEHDEYKWVTPEECYSMKNLTHGFHDLLEKTGYIKK